MAAPEQGAPVCLISQDGDQLQVHEAGLEVLRQLGTTPVATIAVAGMYRTGKSFFLNQLCGAPVGTSFRVGHTSESCTRGIWLWVVPETTWSSADHPGTRLLLLDTEGLASIDQDETYDAKVFSLGILLSSFFIYNSMGVIDESAIDRLFLVGELTKNVCLNAEKPGGGEPGSAETDGVDEAALAQFFPPFLWLLRDFHLDLERDGQPITLEQYLEQALEDRPGTSRRVQDNNRIRHSFKNLFRQRQVKTLIRPVLDESELKKLATLDSSQLRPEFREQMSSLRTATLTSVQPKMLYGKVLSGAALASLAMAYVAAINDGAVPDIKKSWDYVVGESLRKAYEAARQLHSDEVAASLAGPPLPTRAAFDALDAAARIASRDRFGQLAGSLADHGAGDSWLQNLEQAWSEQAAAALADLDRQSEAHCTSLLAHLFEEKLRKPEAAGAFDNPTSRTLTDSSGSDKVTAAMPEQILGDAVGNMLREYDEEASGPAVARSLAAGLRTQLLPVVQSWSARRDARHQAESAAASAALAVEKQSVATLEEVVAGRDSLVHQLQTTQTSLEGRLEEERTERQRAHSLGEQARAELDEMRRVSDNLRRDVQEGERLQAAEAARYKEATENADRIFNEAKDDWDGRESKLTSKVEELEARLEDAIQASNAQIEEIGALKGSLLTAQHDNEMQGQRNAYAIEQANAHLATTQTALAGAEAKVAAAEQALAEERAAVEAEAAAAASKAAAEYVLWDMVATVEKEAARQAGRDESAAMSSRREAELVEEREKVQRQLEQFVSKATNLPGAFQNQIFKDTPKWMEAVMNGEAVTAEHVKAAAGEGGDEECTIM
eukprot:SAG31_NODE_742_length_12424_cov_16.082353_14_plen_838_part_00